MYREDQRCLKVIAGLQGLLRHHVNILPGPVVLAVLENREIESAKLFSDLFEVRSITAISTEEDLGAARCPKRIGGPQSRIAPNSSAGKMPRRQDMRSESITEIKVVAPVAFFNSAAGVSPSFEMRANAQRANYPLHSRLHLC